jgi:hypothetical protein
MVRVIRPIEACEGNADDAEWMGYRCKTYLIATLLPTLMLLSYSRTSCSIAMHRRAFHNLGRHRRRLPWSDFDEVAIFAEHKIRLIELQQIVDVRYTCITLSPVVSLEPEGVGLNW